MPIYQPLISGSAIIFMSASDGTGSQLINQYTSSNPALVAAGTHQGTWFGPDDLHLKFLDTSVSGSHSVWGPWTGSWTYYTESGTNSHGIPVGSSSIFTSSLAMEGTVTDTGSYPGQVPLIMSMSDSGDFSISTKAAAGGAKDASVLFVKSNGNVALGSENPTKAMEINGNAASATNALGATTTARTTNAAHYISFVGGTSGIQSQYAEGNLQYNPATRKLSAGFFVGDGSLLTNLPGGGGSDCAEKIKTYPMLEGAHPILTEPPATEGEEEADCENVFACEAVAVDCTRKGIWINGGLITHDRGRFIFEYDGAQTIVEVKGGGK